MTTEAYSDAELTYSATARCHCGAGLAYPGNHDAAMALRAWTCSRVLRDGAAEEEHDRFPFAFYEAKSERTPSANGATTRPAEAPPADDVPPASYRPTAPPLTMRDLADDPTVVLDLARMLRKINVTLYATEVCPDPDCGYTSGNPYAEPIEDLEPEAAIVEGVLRGWSPEQVHGVVHERMRLRHGPPDRKPAFESYRDLPARARKSFSVDRACVEYVAQGIVESNGGWERDPVKRAAKFAVTRG